MPAVVLSLLGAAFDSLDGNHKIHKHIIMYTNHNQTARAFSGISIRRDDTDRVSSFDLRSQRPCVSGIRPCVFEIILGKSDRRSVRVVSVVFEIRP